jgi:hypothetical protein
VAGRLPRLEQGLRAPAPDESGDDEKAGASLEGCGWKRSSASLSRGHRRLKPAFALTARDKGSSRDWYIPPCGNRVLPDGFSPVRRLSSPNEQGVVARTLCCLHVVYRRLFYVTVVRRGI